MTYLRSVRVDEAKWLRWKGAAQSAGLDRSEWIRRACDAAVEDGRRVLGARERRDLERAAMRGRVCPHGRPVGVCLDPSCKGVS